MTYTDLIDRITVIEPADIDPDFAEATRHARSCRCNKCLRWWALVGPDQIDDDEPYYGPFTFEEIWGANYGKSVEPFQSDGAEIPF